MISKSFALKLFILSFAVAATLFMFPYRAQAQGMEVSGGYSHITSNFGLDGFDLGTGWWFTPRISAMANYDDAWDTSRVGSFEFTDLGTVTSKNHYQDFLIGPRYDFGSMDVGSGDRTLIPFADFRIGASHLHQQIEEADVFAADSATGFAWMLGGGVDYTLSSHWAARGDLSYLRTHLGNQGQNRFRLAIGLSYNFGSR